MFNDHCLVSLIVKFYFRLAYPTFYLYELILLVFVIDWIICLFVCCCFFIYKKTRAHTHTNTTTKHCFGFGSRWGFRCHLKHRWRQGEVLRRHLWSNRFWPIRYRRPTAATKRLCRRQRLRCLPACPLYHFLLARICTLVLFSLLRPPPPASLLQTLFRMSLCRFVASSAMTNWLNDNYRYTWRPTENSPPSHEYSNESQADFSFCCGSLLFFFFLSFLASFLIDRNAWIIGNYNKLDWDLQLFKDARALTRNERALKWKSRRLCTNDKINEIPYNNPHNPQVSYNGSQLKNPKS